MNDPPLSTETVLIVNSRRNRSAGYRGHEMSLLPLRVVGADRLVIIDRGRIVADDDVDGRE